MRVVGAGIVVALIMTAGCGGRGDQTGEGIPDAGPEAAASAAAVQGQAALAPDKARVTVCPTRWRQSRDALIQCRDASGPDAAPLLAALDEPGPEPTASCRRSGNGLRISASTRQDSLVLDSCGNGGAGADRYAVSPSVIAEAMEVLARPVQVIRILHVEPRGDEQATTAFSACRELPGIVAESGSFSNHGGPPAVHDLHVAGTQDQLQEVQTCLDAMPAPGTFTVTGPPTPVTWTLASPTSPTDRRLELLVSDSGCSTSPTRYGRILQPQVSYGAASITVEVKAVPYPVTGCEQEPPTEYEMVLSEPVGSREVIPAPVR